MLHSRFKKELRGVGFCYLEFSLWLPAEVMVRIPELLHFCPEWFSTGDIMIYPLEWLLLNSNFCTLDRDSRRKVIQVLSEVRAEAARGNITWSDIYNLAKNHQRLPRALFRKDEVREVVGRIIDGGMTRKRLIVPEMAEEVIIDEVRIDDKIIGLKSSRQLYPVIVFIKLLARPDVFVKHSTKKEILAAVLYFYRTWSQLFNYASGTSKSGYEPIPKFFRDKMEMSALRFLQHFPYQSAWNTDIFSSMDHEFYRQKIAALGNASGNIN